MKRTLALIMALCMVLALLPITAVSTLADDTPAEGANYDYYCYMPDVYSDDITVTIDGVDYLRYPVKVSDLASVTSLGGVTTDSTGAAIDGLLIDSFNLFIGYESDKLTYVYDNIDTNEYCLTEWQYKMGKAQSADFFPVRTAEVANTTSTSLYNSHVSYNFAWASGTGTGDDAKNGELAYMLFAVPDLPDGTVLHFEFVNGVRPDGYQFTNMMWMINRAPMLSTSKTYTPVDEVDHAYIGFIDGTITMGSRPVVTATPIPSETPTPAPDDCDIVLSVGDVTSDAITVDVNGTDYLKYDVKISDYATLLNARLADFQYYLLWDTEKLPLVCNSEDLGVQTLYTTTTMDVQVFTGTMCNNNMTALASRYANGNLSGFSQSFATANAVDAQDNTLISLYFAVPDLPCGTVIPFYFGDTMFVDDTQYNTAQAGFVSRTNMDGSGNPVELDRAYIGRQDGSITIKNHSYTATVTTAATCTADGLMTYTCACGDTYTEVIPALGHTVVAYADVAATCTTGGQTGGTYCSVCGEQLTAPTATPKLGHDLVRIVTVPATCSTVGTAHNECTRCDFVGTDVVVPIDPNNHEAIVTDAAVAPTCTETGLTEGSHCTACGKTITKQTTLPALGHAWDSGEVTTAATCTAAGEKTFTCSRCGETKTEVIAIDPNNHTDVVTDAAVAATCTTDGLTAGSHCAACGTILVAQEVIPMLGHDWGDWTHDADSAPSTHTRVCANDASHTETDACVFGTTFDEATNENVYTCPVCGYSYRESTGFTVTFMAGDTVVATYTIAANEALGDRIPDTKTAPVKVQNLAAFWPDTVTADYVVTGDVTFHAEYWKFGDANLDGSVTSADAAALLRFIVGLDPLRAKAKYLANVDGDSLTSADATLILRYVVGLTKDIDPEM